MKEGTRRLSSLTSKEHLVNIVDTNLKSCLAQTRELCLSLASILGEPSLLPDDPIQPRCNTSSGLDHYQLNSGPLLHGSQLPSCNKQRNNPRIWVDNDNEESNLSLSARLPYGKRIVHSSNNEDHFQRFDKEKTSYWSSMTTQEGKTDQRRLMTLTGLIDNLEVTVLIDCGATRNFIAADLMKKIPEIHVEEQPTKTELTLGDGSKRLFDTKTATLELRLDSLLSTSEYEIVPGIPKYDIILGMPWLQQFNPDIDWRKHAFTVRNTIDCDEEPKKKRTTGTMDLMMKRTTEMTAEDNIDQPIERTEELTEERTKKLTEPPTEGSTKTTNFAMISARQLKRHIHQKCDCFLVVIRDHQKKNFGEVDPEIRTLLNHYDDVFVNDLPPTLPPERETDHQIHLESGHSPPWKRPYRLTQKEQDELKTQLEDLLEKGFIRPSNSPFGAPVLFVKKKDGSFRMCIDYRALNKITIKDKYPLPMIDDLLDRLCGATIFSKIDLKKGYYQVRVADEDIPKTAFCTRYGSFEFLVLPFGLTNAPPTFVRMMNEAFRPLLDKCVIIWLDDILVFSKNKEDHLLQLNEVFKILKEKKLYAGIDKCSFGLPEVDFVGFLIRGDGIHTDPKKIQAVKDWPTPTTTYEARSFTAMANFYRRFVPDFSKIASPLHRLSEANREFSWNKAEEDSFQQLKKQLIEAPILRLFDPTLPTIVTTDASDIALGAVLSQLDEHGERPVAFESRKLNIHEKNYPPHKKELLAIVHALKHWKVYLMGIHFIVKTDHKPLKHIDSQPNITGIQARWMETLAEYDYDIEYKTGKIERSCGLS